MRCKIGDGVPDVVVKCVDVPLPVGLDLKLDARYRQTPPLGLVTHPPEVLPRTYPERQFGWLPLFLWRIRYYLHARQCRSTH